MARIHRSQLPSLIAAAGVGLFSAGLAGADDTTLFTARVTPNVLLMIDNSSSMNEIMEHPVYNRSNYPFSCNIIDPAASGTSGTVNDQDGRATPWRCTSIGCFIEFDNSITGFTVTPSTADDAETGYITRRFCGQTRKIYHDGGLTNIGGVSTNDNKTRWLEQYIEWYFSINTASTTTYTPTNQTASEIVADIDDTANGRHYIDGSYFGLYQRSRITGAREIATDVIYQTNSNCPAYAGDCGEYEDNIRFGLATFQSNSEGGFVNVPVAPYSSTQRTALADAIVALDPQTNTPLAETLFKLYTYFMHRTDSNMRPAGAINNSYRFPAYSYRTTDGMYTTTSSSIPADPVAQSCQKHFIIMITDGEPTSDNFSTNGNETLGFGDFESRLVGNLATDAVGDIDTPETGSPPWASGGTGYLDDLAQYMQRDMRLDMTGTQKVDVYTIGFDTFGMASALLAKTAARGNGLFAESSQSDALTQALVNAIADIILKAQVFTAATVPASRTTSGDNFYSAFFVPVQNSPFWQGHLKDWEFSADGDVLTPSGQCATGDAGTSPPCDSASTLNTSADAFWDAALEVPAPNNRKLYLELGATSMFAQPSTFTIPGTLSTAVAWFGLVAADNTVAPYVSLSPKTTTDMAQALIRYLRGCQFSNSTTCTARMDVTGTHPDYMGDIFHSNPVVVGSPSAAVSETSYKQFATTYKTRPRIVYAGANDGFVHAFHAGTWRTLDTDGTTPLNPPRHDHGTGQEIMGFMPYGARTSVKDFVKFTSGLRPDTQVLVDGSPSIADVWFNRNVVSGALTSVNPTAVTKQQEQWRTVLIQSLRNGGQHYSAIDVTDPPNSVSTSTSTYPRYLWGFPPDDPSNAANGTAYANTSVPLTSTEGTYVGYTWSEPIIARVRVKAQGGTDPRGYERWVAIFGGGYHAAGDPNGTAYKIPTDAGYTAKGRAIYMVDISTGKVLARKVFDPTATALSSATAEQVGIREMVYAIPSAPAVFDIDFDGFTDVIYIGDLGGNVWKWVVTDPGQDPINNSSTDNDPTQPDWPFRLFFRGTISTDTTPTDTTETLPNEFSGASGGTWNSAIHYQSFFFPPTGGLKDGNLVLAFGAGERNNPIGPASRFGDGTTLNNNHYYVVKDTDPLEKVGTLPNRLTGRLIEGNLADFDASTPLTCAQMKATKSGYYITGRDAEKFLSASTIIFDTVFTGSFLPADPSSTTACDSRGTAYLYAFDLECGVGKFPEDPGTAQDERRHAVGSGLPTRPRVSIGEANQGGGGGGGGGGCNNRLVIVSSDGGFWNNSPGCMSGSPVKVRSWRER